MFSLTAAGSASIRLNDATIRPLLDLASVLSDAVRIELYHEKLQRPKPQLSDKVAIYRLDPVPPTWLENTQRAIRESRAPSDSEATGDGRWLSQSVANAAHDFFENTGDLLPDEPYIYSSRQGDLVAEFKAQHGSLTAIVASTFVLLFAVVDGQPFERRVSESQNLRAEVQGLTDALRSGLNGTLDAKK